MLMKRSLFGSWKNGISRVVGIGTILIFLLGWEAISRSGLVNANLFPPPSVVFRTAGEMLISGELIVDVALSLQRVVVGFIAGSILGVILGVLAGRMVFFDRSLGRLIQLFRPIPAIAFVPLAIIWLGLGEPSKYFLITWGVFFPMWLNTYIGVSRVDPTLIWAAKSLGATDRKILYEVIIPYAVPFIIAGARIGIAIAFVCLVAAEMAGAFSGIGYRISASHMMFRIDKMMVALAMLGVLGASADFLFSKSISRIIPWYTSQRKET
jgi:NitT/TauT family transport system permease protein/sulfonate transport system permease protein